MASDNEASCIGDPNFAVICEFLQKFGILCGLNNIDFVDLQKMIENTQDVPQPLMDLHLKLLRRVKKTVPVERWERVLSKICHTYNNQDGWEIERFGYKKAGVSCKLRTLKTLMEMQFDYHTKFKNEVNKLSAEQLRSQPLGKDKLGHAYWYQIDDDCQIRVYKEDPDEETWLLVAQDRDGLESLITQLKENDSVMIGIEPVLNEDSNSLEIEKPILDTGQVDSVSNKSPPDEKIGRTDQEKRKQDESNTDKPKKSTTKQAETSETVTTKPVVDNTEKEVEDVTPPPKPMICLRLKPINELLSSPPINLLKSDNIQTQKRPNEDALEPTKPAKKQKLTLLNSKQLSKTNRRPVEESSDEDEEDDGEEDDEDDDESDDISEEIEEPVMYVKGRGRGKDNCSANIRIPPNQIQTTNHPGALNVAASIGYEESPIIGEEISEDVLYIYGEGSGTECLTGNDNDNKNDTAILPGKDTCQTDKTITSNKKSIKLGMVLDSKLDKNSEHNKSPIKKNRWDVGKPTTTTEDSLAVEETEKPKVSMFFFGPKTKTNAGISFFGSVPDTVTDKESIDKTDSASDTSSISIENSIVMVENKSRVDTNNENKKINFSTENNSDTVMDNNIHDYLSDKGSSSQNNVSREPNTTDANKSEILKTEHTIATDVIMPSNSVELLPEDLSKKTDKIAIDPLQSLDSDLGNKVILDLRKVNVEKAVISDMDEKLKGDDTLLINSGKIEADKPPRSISSTKDEVSLVEKSKDIVINMNSEDNTNCVLSEVSGNNRTNFNIGTDITKDSEIAFKSTNVKDLEESPESLSHCKTDLVSMQNICSTSELSDDKTFTSDVNDAIEIKRDKVASHEKPVVCDIINSISHRIIAERPKPLDTKSNIDKSRRVTDEIVSVDDAHIKSVDKSTDLTSKTSKIQKNVEVKPHDDRVANSPTPESITVIEGAAFETKEDKKDVYTESQKEHSIEANNLEWPQSGIISEAKAEKELPVVKDKMVNVQIDKCSHQNNSNEKEIMHSAKHLSKQPKDLNTEESAANINSENSKTAELESVESHNLQSEYTIEPKQVDAKEKKANKELIPSTAVELVDAHRQIAEKVNEKAKYDNRNSQSTDYLDSPKPDPLLPEITSNTEHAKANEKFEKLNITTGFLKEDVKATTSLESAELSQSLPQIVDANTTTALKPPESLESTPEIEHVNAAKTLMSYTPPELNQTNTKVTKYNVHLDAGCSIEHLNKPNQDVSIKSLESVESCIVSTTEATLSNDEPPAIIVETDISAKREPICFKKTFAALTENADNSLSNVAPVIEEAACLKKIMDPLRDIDKQLDEKGSSSSDSTALEPDTENFVHLTKNAEDDSSTIPLDVSKTIEPVKKTFAAEPESVDNNDRLPNTFPTASDPSKTKIDTATLDIAQPLSAENLLKKTSAASVGLATVCLDKKVASPIQSIESVESIAMDADCRASSIGHDSEGDGLAEDPLDNVGTVSDDPLALAEEEQANDIEDAEEEMEEEEGVEAEDDDVNADVAEGSEVEAEGSENEADGSEVEAEGSEVEEEDSEVEAAGSEVEAEGSEVEAEGSEVEAEGSEVEAEGTEVEAEGSEVEAEGSEVEAEASEIEGEGSDIEAEGDVDEEEEEDDEDDEEEEIVEPKVKKGQEKNKADKKKKVSLTSFSMDFNDSSDSVNIPSIIKEKLKNRKLAMKKPVAADDSDCSGDEEAEEEEDADDENVDEEEDEDDEDESDEADEEEPPKPPPKQLGKKKKVVLPPVIPPPAASVKKSTTADLRKERKKKKTIMGLEIPEVHDVKENEVLGVRQSRRIAQIKIREDAEKRKIEDLSLAQAKFESRKMFETSEKLKKVKLSSDEEYVAEVDDKKKKKKKRKHTKFDEHNPWKSSSDSSTSQEEEQEEYDESDHDDRHRELKSDHEFSPESDLEDETEVKPMKRARTVRKEDKAEQGEEDLDDTSCEKCSKTDHPEWILLCDGCDHGWHCSCLRPALLVIPEGDWFCPPCQHATLLTKLEEQLVDLDKRRSKQQIEVRRKERLAYVGISLNNVLSTKDKDGAKSDKSDKKSDSSSSGSSSESSDSDEPIYQLRQRRQAHSYRFNDYDDLINSAIQDEEDPEEEAGDKQVSGKDIATIVNAEKGQQKRDDDDADGDDVKAPSKIPLVKRKKKRKLNTLELSSGEDGNSDSDFRGSSTDEDDEDADEFDDQGSDSSDSIGRKRKKRGGGGTRRSTRDRWSRMDRAFIDDDSDYEEEKQQPKKKRKRGKWTDSEDLEDEDESELSDSSWNKKRKRGSNRSSSRSKSKKSKNKQKNRGSDSDDEPVQKKKRKIKFGGLNDSDEEECAKVDSGRRTRGKKITYVDALGTDSDEEIRRRSAKGKVEESEDEYVADEDEELQDEDGNEIEKDSDESDSAVPAKTHIKPVMKKGKGKGGITRIKRAQGIEDGIEELFPSLKSQNEKDNEKDSPKTDPPEKATEEKPKETETAPEPLPAPERPTTTSATEDKPADTIEVTDPMQEINRNIESMDEKLMMEDPDYATKQLQMVATQLERKKKEDALSAADGSAALSEDMLQHRRGRKPKVIPYMSPSPQVLQAKLQQNEDVTDTSSNSPGPPVPAFSELSSADDSPVKKRRGRGKGKKTLEKEAAAAAALAAAASSLAKEDLGAPPPTDDMLCSTKPRTGTSSPIVDASLAAGKLAIATPPQPFSQTEPAPSVITRMLQAPQSALSAPGTPPSGSSSPVAGAVGTYPPNMPLQHKYYPPSGGRSPDLGAGGGQPPPMGGPPRLRAALHVPAPGIPHGMGAGSPYHGGPPPPPPSMNHHHLHYRGPGPPPGPPLPPHMMRPVPSAAHSPPGLYHHHHTVDASPSGGVTVGSAAGGAGGLAGRIPPPPGAHPRLSGPPGSGSGGPPLVPPMPPHIGAPTDRHSPSALGMSPQHPGVGGGGPPSRYPPHAAHAPRHLHMPPVHIQQQPPHMAMPPSRGPPMPHSTYPGGYYNYPLPQQGHSAPPEDTYHHHPPGPPYGSPHPPPPQSSSSLPPVALPPTSTRGGTSNDGPQPPGTVAPGPVTVSVAAPHPPPISDEELGVVRESLPSPLPPGAPDEDTTGEFGGLVSYFSSQREDDLDG